MIKKIGIVSLSKGTIGEAFVKHEVDLGLKRLEGMGLEIVFLDNALKGIDYLYNHPEKRAQDLINAYKDESIDMILCAIGGDDTYRLLPYLFDNDELKNVVNNKIFLGFSDTTTNHFMLHKLGINTFYGQSFLADICDLDKDINSYTKKYFLELINTGRIKEITPSDTWQHERQDFSVEAIGTSLTDYNNQGYELIQGNHQFSGKILGGCIDTIYDMFDNERYDDSVELCRKYNLFPSLDDWKGKILLLETSEEKPNPEKYLKAIRYLKNTGIFGVLNGILIGKPANEQYFDEYKKILKQEINEDLPILANINIGHSTPRCIIPFGVEANVDFDRQIIEFKYEK